MLLNPETLDLAPCAPALLTRSKGDARFKPELPAAQLEIVGRPAATVRRGRCGAAASAARPRAGGRRARAARGRRRPPLRAGHRGESAPVSATRGSLAEFGGVARRQLVFGLHVHVARQRRRPSARRLQRAARGAAGARRARRRVPVLRRPRHRPGVGATQAERVAAPPGDPARVRRLGGTGAGAVVGPGPGRVRRRALVVGNAAASGARDDRDPGSRHPADRPRDRGNCRRGPRAGGHPGRAPRCGGICPRRPRPGGSPRTGGRRAGMASRARGSTRARVPRRLPGSTCMHCSTACAMRRRSSAVALSWPTHPRGWTTPRPSAPAPQAHGR